MQCVISIGKDLRKIQQANSERSFKGESLPCKDGVLMQNLSVPYTCCTLRKMENDVISHKPTGIVDLSLCLAASYCLRLAVPAFAYSI